MLYLLIQEYYEISSQMWKIIPIRDPKSNLTEDFLFLIKIMSARLYANH
jgi:hypothetical protein